MDLWLKVLLSSAFVDFRLFSFIFHVSSFIIGETKRYILDFIPEMAIQESDERLEELPFCGLGGRLDGRDDDAAEAFLESDRSLISRVCPFFLAALLLSLPMQRP